MTTLLKFMKPIIVGVIFLFMTGRSYTQTIHPNLLEKIDSLAWSSMENYKIPGMAVGIIDAGDLVKIKGYGYADVQNSAPVIDSTSFELASLTKQFTATAIVLLQQKGKLSVDDYLYEYVPETPEAWKGIKLKHLIWHTSGLPGMFPRDSFTSRSFSGYAHMSSAELDEMMQHNTVSKKIAIQSVLTDQLDFEPGEKYNYSDVGYLMLGLVIDNITGSYRDFMQKEIFEPCGMQNTYMLDQQKVVRNQSRGYSLNAGEVINIMRTWDYEIPAFYGVFSNVYDLHKWNTIILGNTLLNEESRTFLFTKGTLDDGTRINYGGGWMIQEINGVKYVYHGGVTGVNYMLMPQKNISIITLTNLGYNGHDPVGSLNVVKEILFFLDLANLTDRSYIAADGSRIVETDQKMFDQLVGKYTTIDGIGAEIYMQDGAPIFDCPAQGMKHEIAMLKNEKWVVLGLDFEYTLDFNKKEQSLSSNLFRTFNKTE